MPIYSNSELRRELGNQITRRWAEMPDDIQVLAKELQRKLPSALEVESLDICSPLLLVLPFERVPFERQLEAIRYAPEGSELKPKPGYAFLKPENLVDINSKEIGVPRNKPYLILQVNSGSLTRGLSPENATALLSSKFHDRHPVSVEQGLALAVLKPEVFDRLYIHLSGSRIKDEKTGELFAPDFWVYGGQIKMKRDSADAYDSRWGTSSWSGIITP